MNRPYREWDETEIYFLRTTAGLLTSRQAAERLHRPSRNVREKARQLGITLKQDGTLPGHPRLWTDAELTLVQHCVANGLSSEDASKILANAGYTRSPGAIRRIWKQYKETTDAR